MADETTSSTSTNWRAALTGMSFGEEPSGGRLTRSGSDGERGVDPEGAIVLAPREGRRDAVLVGGATLSSHRRARSCSVSRQSQHPQQHPQQQQQQQQLSPQSAPVDESATIPKRSKSKKHSSSDTSQGSSRRHRLVNDKDATSVSKTRSTKKELSASFTRRGSSCRQRLVDHNSISSVSAAPKIIKRAQSNDREGSVIKHLAESDAASSTHNDSWRATKNVAPNNNRNGLTKRQQLSVQDNASSSSFSVRDTTASATNKNVEVDDDYSNSQRPKSKPAFPGAKFDAQGYCIHHPSMRLQERRFDKWHIFHKHCPKCHDGGGGGSSIGDRRGKEKHDRGRSRGNAAGDTRSVNKIIEEVHPEENRRGRSLSRIQSLSRGVVRSVSKAHHGNDKDTSSLERGGGKDKNENNRGGSKFVRRLSNRFNSSEKINNDVGYSNYQSVHDDGVGGGGESVASSNSLKDMRKTVDRASDGSIDSSSQNMSAEITAIVPKPSPSCDDSNDHDDTMRSSSWRRRNYCQSISTRSVSPLPTPGNRSSSRKRMNSIDPSFDRCRRSPSTKVRQASSFDSQSSFRRDGRRRSDTRSSSPSFRSLSPSHRDGHRKSWYHRQSSPMRYRGSLSVSSRQSNNRNRRSSENPNIRSRSREHRISRSPSVRSLGSSRSRRSANHRRSRVEHPNRSFSRRRAVSADRRRSGRQHRPIRSHSQVRNYERRPTSRGRPMSNRRQGGRRSKSHGPIGADSYALVVRERTPSPRNRYAPRRHRSSSRRPPLENQLVEYDFSQRHRHNSLSPSPVKSRRRQDHWYPPPQSSNTRSRRTGAGKSKAPSRRPTRAQPRPSRSSVKSRSRSTTPEIWIICPKTEDDPFENSFATFEEWNLSPQSQSKQQVVLPPAMSTLTDSGRENKSLNRLHPLSKDRLPFLDKQNSFDNVPQRQNLRKMTPPISMSRNNSFNSLEGAMAPKRRENSLERRLPEWSDLNAQTRSKAANLSMLSQQISSMSRRNSRVRSGSPGWQMSTSNLRQERHHSSMKQSKSFNSLEEEVAPLRNSTEQRLPELSDNKFRTRSKAADLLVLSQEISTLSRRESHARSVSTGRGHIHDRQIGDSERKVGDSELKGLERRTSGMRYSFGDNQPQVERDRGPRVNEKIRAGIISPGMSQVEMALAIIEETQGKKLPRWDNPGTKMRSIVLPSAVAPSPASQRPSDSTSPVRIRPTSVASTSRSKSPAGSARRSIKSLELSSNFNRRVNLPAVRSILGDPEETPRKNDSPQQPPSHGQKQHKVKPRSFSTLSIDRQEPALSVNHEWQKEHSKVDDHRQSPSKHLAPRSDGSNHVSSLNENERSKIEQQEGDCAGQSVCSSKFGRDPRKQKNADERKADCAGQSVSSSKFGRDRRKQKKTDERKNVIPAVGRSISPGGMNSTSPGKNGLRRKSTMFGEPQKKNGANVRQNCRSVKNMPFTDHFGETGMYTGQVNEDCRPDGKGSMKYENGVYYEGLWSNGCQDENAASQYGRIRGGFTGWSGKGKEASRSGMTLPWNARKSDAYDPNEKINVRGMEWSDINGQSGRYTGEVNKDQIPHGRGMMKYDYGLIADGRWVNGVLDEGPQDRMISANASMGTGTVASTLSMGPMSAGPGLSVGPGMSIGPGMSLGPAISIGAGMSVGPGMSSVGPGSVIRMQGPSFPMGHMTTIGSMAAMHHTPVQFVNMNPMITAEQHAMMRMHGGGSSVYRSPIMGMPIQPPMQILLPQTQHLQQGQSDKPPISEIKINAETQ